MAGYVKITFEDIEIAKNFFENEKHLDEFLVNVCKYYCGYENVFKYKNVKKFFETYKKTMDRVILGRSTGSIGGKKRVENQQDTSDTLEGVLEGGVKDPVQAKLIKEKKEIKLKKVTKEIEYIFLGELQNIKIESDNEEELRNRYSQQKLDAMVKKLDSWLQTKGKQCNSYKSLIAYFNNWVEKDYEENKPQVKRLHNHGIPVN